MTVYKNYFCIKYDEFTPKMSRLFQILDNKEGEFNIRIGDHLHNFDLYLEDDGKYKALCLNHGITIDGYIKPERRIYSDCYFEFRFHHRKRLFEWYEYVHDNLGDFPVMDHVLFRCKNLVYPDLFLKHVDMMMVELV